MKPSIEGRHLPSSAKSIVRRLAGKFRGIGDIFEPSMLTNVYQRGEVEFHQRALLHYLLKPFRLRNGSAKFYWNQNLTVSRLIGEVLHEEGYIVDVAQFNDKQLNSDHKYDIVITHNLSLVASLRDRLRAGGICVYLSSGQHHTVANAKITHRYLQFKERTGMQLSPIMQAPANTHNLSFVDAIIGFGNDNTASTWKRDFQGPILTFNNFAFEGILRRGIQRDYSLARKEFLYLGSIDQVSRGLDLLLEAFSELPGFNLYVAAPYEYESHFVRVYRKLLFGLPNIHALGKIRVNTKPFLDLLKRCGYIVYPTCSEGSSGSLLVGMAGGLIPITTAEAGIDLEGCGVALQDLTVSGLRDVLSHLAAREPSWHEDESARVRILVKRKYSIQALTGRLREIVGQLKLMVTNRRRTP